MQFFLENVWRERENGVPLHPLSRNKPRTAQKKEFFERFKINRQVVQEAGASLFMKWSIWVEDNLSIHFDGDTNTYGERSDTEIEHCFLGSSSKDIHTMQSLILAQDER